MTPEGRIKKAICDYLALWKGKGRLDFWINTSVGIWDPVKRIYRRNSSRYASTGVPDISVILASGVAAFIEVKTKKGVLSESQNSFKLRVEKMNARYVVARCVEDVERFLRYLQDPNTGDRGAYQ